MATLKSTTVNGDLVVKPSNGYTVKLETMKSWQNQNYPTLHSTEGHGWIMLLNPHICDYGKMACSSTLDASCIRMESRMSNASYFDLYADRTGEFGIYFAYNNKKLFTIGTSWANFTLDNNIKVNGNNVIHEGNYVTYLGTYLDGRYLNKYGTNTNIAGGSGNGQYSYCRMIEITTGGQYINRPICFEVSGRGLRVSHIQVEFQNTNNTDPGLALFTCDYNGGNYYIKKTATQKWSIYCTYSESWGTIYVHRVYGEGVSSVTIAYPMEQLTSLPGDLTGASERISFEGHNHDSAYSKLDHNHDSTYSKTNHNHDGVYAAADHSHSTYLPKSGGTLTGSLTFANGTYNVVGDDCAIGDINVAGTLGIKGQNGQTNIAFVNQSNSYYTRLIGQVVGSNRDVYLPSTAGTLCVASYASGTGTLTINT